MALVSDRCICLKKVEYSETSQILTLFGRNRGVVRVIAKGAHRVTKAGASRFGGGVDLLDLGDAVMTDRLDKDLATLTEWSLREGHLPLRRSLRGLYLGFYAAELVSMMVQEHDPHRILFDRLEWTLNQLSTPRGEQAFLAFELGLLRETGIAPQIAACVACGRPVNERTSVSFDPARGGVLCRACETAYPQRLSIDGRLVAMMRYIMDLAGRSNGDGLARLPGLTRHQSDPINRLIAGHVEHTLGRRMRMPRWVI